MPLDVNITFHASDALLVALGRIADGLALLAIPPAPAGSPPARTEPPGVSAAEHLEVPSPGAAEGPSRVAASTAPPAGPSITDGGATLSSGFVSRSVWATEERRAALKTLYPTAPTFQAVFDGVAAASPGVPMPRRQNVRNVALQMGLKRPADAVLPAGLTEHRGPPSARTKARASADTSVQGILANSDAPADHAQEILADAPATTAGLEPAPSPALAAPPPATFGDAIREKGLEEKLLRLATPRGAAVPPAPPPVPRPSLTPIQATQNGITQQCELRGWRFDGPFDLDAINRKLASIGHPGFVLKPAERPTFRRSA